MMRHDKLSEPEEHMDKRPSAARKGEEPDDRFQLIGASPAEIASAQTKMLNELACEAHEFAREYFASARGVEALRARTRKVAMACRLSTLAMRLIAASDRHRKVLEGGD